MPPSASIMASRMPLESTAACCSVVVVVLVAAAQVVVDMGIGGMSVVGSPSSSASVKGLTIVHVVRVLIHFAVGADARHLARLAVRHVADRLGLVALALQARHPVERTRVTQIAPAQPAAAKPAGVLKCASPACDHRGRLLARGAGNLGHRRPKRWKRIPVTFGLAAVVRLDVLGERRVRGPVRQLEETAAGVQHVLVLRAGHRTRRCQSRATRRRGGRRCQSWATRRRGARTRRATRGGGWKAELPRAPAGTPRRSPTQSHVRSTRVGSKKKQRAWFQRWWSPAVECGPRATAGNESGIAQKVVNEESVEDVAGSNPE